MSLDQYLKCTCKYALLCPVLFCNGVQSQHGEIQIKISSITGPNASTVYLSYQTIDVVQISALCATSWPFSCGFPLAWHSLGCCGECPAIFQTFWPPLRMTKTVQKWSYFRARREDGCVCVRRGGSQQRGGTTHRQLSAGGRRPVFLLHPKWPPHKAGMKWGTQPIFLSYRLLFSLLSLFLPSATTPRTAFSPSTNAPLASQFCRRYPPKRGHKIAFT